VAFFRFEHQIRPDHVLPSAAGHDSDDDDFMPFPNARSSSLIDKSKDVAPRKPQQTRAGLVCLILESRVCTVSTVT
jgi:hypothetical protein